MNIDIIKFVQDAELSCMTARQLAIMDALLTGPKSNIELANDLNLSPTTITRSTQKLYKLNLLRPFNPTDLKDLPDQRKKLLSLTVKGRALFQ